MSNSHPNRGNVTRQLCNALRGARSVLETIDPPDAEVTRQIKRANDAINRYERESHEQR